MTEITNYILAKTVEEEEQIASDVGSSTSEIIVLRCMISNKLIGLQDSKIKLIEVVQSIGPYITDDDVIQQAKGSSSIV